MKEDEQLHQRSVSGWKRGRKVRTMVVIMEVDESFTVGGTAATIVPAFHEIVATAALPLFLSLPLSPCI